MPMPRSTVGTATDANAMLRILFSRLGKPHIGSPTGLLVQRRVDQRRAARSPFERGGAHDEGAAQLQRPRRHVPALRGPRLGHRLRPDRSCTTTAKSLNEGALTIPGYSMDGWYGRIFSGCGLLRPGQADPASSPSRSSHDLLYKEPTKIKVDGINLTYEGLIPRIQKSMLSKDIDAMQPHIRAFVERAVTFTTCPDCDGTRLSEAARSSKIKGHQHRRRLRDADQRPGRLGARPRRAVGGTAARRAAADARLVRRDRARLPRRSTGRRARCPAARPSASR